MKSTVGTNILIFNSTIGLEAKFILLIGSPYIWLKQCTTLSLRLYQMYYSLPLFLRSVLALQVFPAWKSIQVLRFRTNCLLTTRDNAPKWTRADHQAHNETIYLNGTWTTSTSQSTMWSNWSLCLAKKLCDSVVKHGTMHPSVSSWVPLLHMVPKTNNEWMPSDDYHTLIRTRPDRQPEGHTVVLAQQLRGR